MEVKRIRTLAIEKFKTVNNMNPSFMKNIFSPKTNAKVRPNNIIVKAHNSANNGDKSLTTLGPKIWNSLPKHIKSENSYLKFKEYIETWFGLIADAIRAKITVQYKNKYHCPSVLHIIIIIIF